MAERKPDLKVQATVAAVRKDETGFMANVDGEERWFKLSTQNTPACPSRGQDILISYNISPGNDQYPDPTYWANVILDPKLVEQNGDGDVHPDWEAGAQRVDATNAAAEKAQPIKADPMGSSIEWQVCIKEASANARANLEHAPTFFKDETRVPIASADVVAEARVLFYGKEVPDLDLKDVEVSVVEGTNEPVPEYTS